MDDRLTCTSAASPTGLRTPTKWPARSKKASGDGGPKFELIRSRTKRPTPSAMSNTSGCTRTMGAIEAEKTVSH